MARNRYSQTSPLEAFSALGQGLQGLAQAMDVSAQQKREMLGNQALSMALGSLANPEVRVDAETYMERVNNLASAFQKIGLNPLQFYQMALQTVPKTKTEQAKNKLDITSEEDAEWNDLLTRFQGSKTPGYAEYILGIMQAEFPDKPLPTMDMLNISPSESGGKIGSASFGKFTTESLKEYEETGDESVLVRLPETPPIGAASLDDYTRESLAKYMETHDPLDLEPIPAKDKFIIQEGNYYEPEEFNSVLDEQKKELKDLREQIKAAKAEGASKDMKKALTKLQEEESTLQKSMESNRATLSIFRWWNALNVQQQLEYTNAMQANPSITKEMLWRKYGR